MKCLLVLAALLGSGLAIPIDNGLAGEPEVQCGPTSVQISFQTENSFDGVVYAKGHNADQTCLSAGSGTTGGGIEMLFDSCNVRRTRSLEPKGIFVTATVVVQFHPRVLTKVDRAFHIRCFYMEADKTVDAELEVSMVTTELRTFTVPMPVCRYDILEDNENGQPIRFVTIGQKVFHKWTCDTETTDTFCMEVYSCYVDDGSGSVESQISLLDEEGCAVDGNLLPNLDYSTDLMGGAQNHVFKYADRPQLYFNCQIRIGVKEPNSDCAEYRGDSCPDAPETTGRKKRAAPAPRKEHPALGVMDITPSYPIFVADVELTKDDIPARLRHLINHSSQEAVLSREQSPDSTQVCLSSPVVGGVVTILALFVLASTAITAYICIRPSSKH